jgi:hypothetical protein
LDYRRGHARVGFQDTPAIPVLVAVVVATVVVLAILTAIRAHVAAMRSVVEELQSAIDVVPDTPPCSYLRHVQAGMMRPGGNEWDTERPSDVLL